MGSDDIIVPAISHFVPQFSRALKLLKLCYQNRHKYSEQSRVLNFIDKYGLHIMNALIVIVLIYKSAIAIFAYIFLVIFMRRVQSNTTLSLQSFGAFMKYFVLTFFVIMAENGCVYIVSYFDDNKFDYEPSQDHFHNVVLTAVPNWNTFFDSLVPFFQFPGADDFLIVIGLWALAGMLGRIHVHKVDAFRWGALFMRALCYTRVIRTIAFISTVMPNPQKDCFKTRFTMHTNYKELFVNLFGFKFGGCNDLVISGHTLFISLLNSVIGAAMVDVKTRWSITVMRVLSPFILLNMIMGRHHYSVDIFLGVIISKLIWEREMRLYDSYFTELELKESQLSKKALKISSRRRRSSSN